MRQFRLGGLAALGALLAGCGGSGSSAGAPTLAPVQTPVTVLASPSTTPAPSQTATPSASADPRDVLSGSTIADSSGFLDPSGEISFRSPTQNIGCTVGAAAAACQIARFSYTPRTPSACHGNGVWGSTIDLMASAQFSCATDAVASGAKQLAYGQRLERGHMICVSRTDGVTCVNRVTGNGFRVAERDYDFF